MSSTAPLHSCFWKAKNLFDFEKFFFFSFFKDRYADGYSVPVLDKYQDYNLTGFSEKDGTTILKFKRKIDTCDSRDRKIMVRVGL